MDKSPRQPFITQSVHFRAWRWKCLSRRAHMAYSEVTLDGGTLFSNLVLSVWCNYANVCANDIWWWRAIFREAHWSSLYFICISFGSFPTIQGNIKPQLAVRCGSSCDKLLRGDDVFPLRWFSPTLICWKAKEIKQINKSHQQIENESNWMDFELKINKQLATCLLSRGLGIR